MSNGERLAVAIILQLTAASRLLEANPSGLLDLAMHVVSYLGVVAFSVYLGLTALLREAARRSEPKPTPADNS